MTMQSSIADACEAVPGLLSGALVMLPEGLVIAGLGAGGAVDREPLVRSAARCLATARPTPGMPVTVFVEYAFVSEDQLVVIERGQRDARVALVVVCNRDANLALVLGSARHALRTIESTLDLSAWEA